MPPIRPGNRPRPFRRQKTAILADHRPPSTSEVRESACLRLRFLPLQAPAPASDTRSCALSPPQLLQLQLQLLVLRAPAGRPRPAWLLVADSTDGVVQVRQQLVGGSGDASDKVAARVRSLRFYTQRKACCAAFIHWRPQRKPPCGFPLARSGQTVRPLSRLHPRNSPLRASCHLAAEEIRRRTQLNVSQTRMHEREACTLPAGPAPAPLLTCCYYDSSRRNGWLDGCPRQQPNAAISRHRPRLCPQ